jgi:hypothetical protein
MCRSSISTRGKEEVAVKSLGKLLLVLWGVVAVGCYGEVAPIRWAPISSGEISARDDAKRDVVVDTSGWMDQVQRARLDAASAATNGVVQRDTFRNALRSVDQLSGGADRSPMSGAQVLGLYEKDELQVKYVPSDKAHETGDTGIEKNGAGGYVAVTHLGVDNLVRWAKGDGKAAIVARACLVNTIAHEWTHAIPTETFEWRFTDAGHKGSAQPLVSYSVGAIAQCAYLEESHLLPKPLFARCVEQVGTRDFFGKSPGVCDEAWIDRLAEQNGG